MAVSDTALLRRWQKTRDADTFVEIVSRHSAMVYATCHRILRNAADAEDVTQDCFAELVRSSASVQRSLGGWLHALATHRSLNRVRADRRRENREARFAQQSPILTQPAWNDLQEHVDEAIASLPEELREPVIRRFLYGDTHDAIARALGVSRSTLLRRLTKGTTEIRRLLERRGIVATVTGLTVLMGANMAEAAPASLIAGLGRLALASSAGNTIMGTTSVASVAKVVGGIIVMKKAVAVIVVIAAAIAGFVVLSDREKPDAAPVTQQTRLDIPKADQQGIDQATQAAEEDPGAETADSAAWKTVGLPSGAAVSGRVYDAETGEGVPGIVVHAFSRSPQLQRESAPTDESGQYIVAGLPAGEYRISQQGDALYLSALPEFTVREKNPPPPERIPPHVRLKKNERIDGVDLPAKRGLRVSGRVVDWDRNPVAGAEVDADGAYGYGMIWCAETDGSGAFAFKKALEPTEALTLEATKEGFNGFARVGPFQLYDDREDIEIVLTRTRSILGVVVDGERKPVAGVKVNASPHDKARGKWGHSKLTDRKGRFEITGVTPGAHRLRAFRPQPDDLSALIELPGGMEVTVPSGRDLTDVLLVLADAGSTLSGSVTDPSGRPLVGASVEFDAHIFKGTAKTGADGGFEIAHVPAHQGILSVSHDGYFSQKIPDVAADGTPVAVTLAPFSGLEVQALNGTTGQPLTEYELAWVKGLKDEVDFSKPLTFQWVHDNEGRFSTNEIEFGEVTVVARAKGFFPAHKGVTLGQRGPMTRLQLRLQEGGTVRGEVVDADGEPVPGALVSAGLPPIDQDRPGVVVTQTTSDGRFELSAALPNATAVCAQHPVYGFGYSPVAGSTRHSQEIRIVLGEPAKVEGVVSEGGAPLRGASVLVVSLLDERLREPLTTRTKPDGSYAFPALPAGAIEILAQSSSGGRRLSRAAITVSGRTTRIDLDFAAQVGILEGTVTLDGAPVEGAYVDLDVTTASGEEHFWDPTDASGSYRIEGLPSGPAQGHVYTMGPDALDFGTFGTEIKEGETTRQDIEASL